MYLSVENAVRRFGDGTTALDGISVCVAKGGILALLGPSGCGKTTLLRSIAGLEQLDSGRILLDGRLLNAVPVHERGIGLMFQDYALFPHLDVAANIAFGLRMRNMDKAETDRRVSECLELVGLTNYDARRIDELSGGESQRVALARSLAPKPEVLLLDEPLGALDRLLRDHLLDELRAILRDIGMTTIFVTHDQGEALAVSDTTAVMREGRVVQCESPQVLHEAPADAWTARFLGYENVIEAEVASGKLFFKDEMGQPLNVQQSLKSDGTVYEVLIKPEAIQLDVRTGFQATVVENRYDSGNRRLVLELAEGTRLVTVTNARDDYPIGSGLKLALSPDSLRLYPR